MDIFKMSNFEKGPIIFFEKIVNFVFAAFCGKLRFWGKCCLHNFFIIFYLRQSLGDFLLIYTKGKRDKC